MSLRITSNYRPRTLLCWDDLLPSEQEDFSMPEYPDECRYVRAYGSTYDLHEFESIARGISVPVVAPKQVEWDQLVTWDGISGQSAWSAIVVRWFDREGYELEGPIVGYATW